MMGGLFGRKPSLVGASVFKRFQPRTRFLFIALATVGGVALNFTHLDPIRALLWSADINCVIAVPIMAVMLKVATDQSIMGQFAIRSKLRNLGWATTALMGVTVGALFVTL